MKPTVRAVAAPLLAVLLAGCGPRDPSQRIVAEVGGSPVTVAAVQAYLDANLVQDASAEAPSAADLVRVKSRLVDDYVDEEIQLREAVRRGVVVTEQDLTNYLGPDAPADPARRALAQRELTIQKLRESVVRGEVKVEESEVDAWIAANAASEPPPLHGTLRTLRFASFPEAERVRVQITSGKLSFLEAAVTYADAAGGGPREVDLSTLPERMADVVTKMKPGEVSAPVPFESSVLLFLLEEIDDQGAAEARRRDRVRNAIAMDLSQKTTERFLEGLRKSTEVKFHPEELPFKYVAE